jgi:O-antigen/teichoic acid export membrane protein
MIKEIYTNYFVKILAFSINSIFPLLVIPYVISVIGLNNFGKVEYGLSILSFFQVIGMLGVPIVGMREISKESDEIKQVSVLFNIMKYVWIINTFVTLSYIILISYFSESWNLSFDLSLSLVFILLANYVNVDWYFEAKKRFKFIAVKSVLTRGLQIILIYLLVKNNKDQNTYALLFSLAVFVGYLFSFLIFLYENYKYLNELTKTTVFLVPLILVFVLQNSNLLYTQIDKIFISNSPSGPLGVAFYAIPQKISVYINAVVYSLSFVAIPNFAKLLIEKKDDYWNLIKKISMNLIFIGFFFGFVVLLFNKEILNYFNITNLNNTNLILFVFMIRIPVIALEGFLNTQVFLLNNKEIILLRYYLIFGLVNVLVNFLLFDNLSPLTALVSTFIIEMLLLFCLINYIKSKINTNFSLIINSPIKIIILVISFLSVTFLLENYINIFYKLASILIILSLLVYLSFYSKKINNVQSN